MRDYNFKMPIFETYHCMYCDEELDENMHCSSCKVFYNLDEDRELCEVEDNEEKYG